MIFFAIDITPAYIWEAIIPLCIIFGLLPFAISSFRNQKWKISKWYFFILTILIVAFLYYYRLFKFNAHQIDRFISAIGPTLEDSENRTLDIYRSNIEVFLDFLFFAAPLAILALLISLIAFGCLKFWRNRKHNYHA